MLQVLKMFACTEKKSKVFLERLSYKTIYGLGTVNSRECTASVFHLNTKAYGMVNERYPCFQSWKRMGILKTKLLLFLEHFRNNNLLWRVNWSFSWPNFCFPFEFKSLWNVQWEVTLFHTASYFFNPSRVWEGKGEAKKINIVSKKYSTRKWPSHPECSSR